MFVVACLKFPTFKDETFLKYLHESQIKVPPRKHITKKSYPQLYFALNRGHNIIKCKPFAKHMSKI